jgi:hypothetical protein
MASGGSLPLAGTGIEPKANTDMALWGIMSPEGPCCFRETSAHSLDRVAKMKTVLVSPIVWRGHGGIYSRLIPEYTAWFRRISR